MSVYCMYSYGRKRMYFPFQVSTITKCTKPIINIHNMLEVSSLTPTRTCVICRYKGRLYDTCITHGNNGVPWCSTSVDGHGVHLEESVKSECPNDTCNINNCPVGFSWLEPTETCYQVTRRMLFFLSFSSYNTIEV